MKDLSLSFHGKMLMVVEVGYRVYESSLYSSSFVYL